MNSELSSVFETAKETHSSLTHTRTGWQTLTSLKRVSASPSTCCYVPFSLHKHMNRDGLLLGAMATKGAILHHCGQGGRKRQGWVNQQQHTFSSRLYSLPSYTNTDKLCRSFMYLSDTHLKKRCFQGRHSHTVFPGWFELNAHKHTQMYILPPFYNQWYIGEDKWNILVNTNMNIYQTIV